MENNSKKIWDNAENIAVKYLENHGYFILEKNYRVRGGEVDIIAQKDEIIIFVEVKFRKNNFFTHPLELFTKQKHISFRRVIFEYINIHNIDEDNCRVDLIAILPKKNSYEITHIKWIELQNFYN